MQNHKTHLPRLRLPHPFESAKSLKLLYLDAKFEILLAFISLKGVWWAQIRKVSLTVRFCIFHTHTMNYICAKLEQSLRDPGRQLLLYLNRMTQLLIKHRIK